jgi:hypothetical protein
MFYVISTRDSLGAVVQVNQNASDLAPFVSRDSVYRYIIGTLDADAELASGGTAFPFSLHAGFAGFNTPTTFRQVNRAIRARASVHFATRGGGNGALPLRRSRRSAHRSWSGRRHQRGDATGVYHVYSTATGDARTASGRTRTTSRIRRMPRTSPRATCARRSGSVLGVA